MAGQDFCVYSCLTSVLTPSGSQHFPSLDHLLPIFPCVSFLRFPVLLLSFSSVFLIFSLSPLIIFSFLTLLTYSKYIDFTLFPSFSFSSYSSFTHSFISHLPTSSTHLVQLQHLPNLLLPDPPLFPHSLWPDLSHSPSPLPHPPSPQHNRKQDIKTRLQPL